MEILPPFSFPLLKMNRVLIVDDQPSFRRQLRQLLSFAGFSVIGESGDISTALKLTREFQPDLAVIDVMLPGENGMVGARKLRRIKKDLRVILVSAHHDSAELLSNSAKNTGAEAFIPKDELDLNVVKKWMNKEEQEGL